MKPLTDDFRIIGERIYLRPITTEDIDIVLNWRNSDYVRDNFFYRKRISYDEQLVWINERVKGGEVYQFVVCLSDDDTPVGCVYLQHYDAESNSMESGVFMSEEAPKGEGIGAEAVALLNNEFAFRYLNLHHTIAKVIDGNKGSLKLHEKVGFKEVKREERPVIPSGELVSSVEFILYNRL